MSQNVTSGMESKINGKSKNLNVSLYITNHLWTVCLNWKEGKLFQNALQWAKSYMGEHDVEN